MDKTRASLIQRVREQNDGQSWTEFITFYQPLLHSYVRSRGVQPAEVDNVVQEIFIRLLNALRTFQYNPNRGRFRTWLYQVTMNVIIDLARHESGRRRAEQEWQQRFGKALVDDEPDEEWNLAHRRRALELAQEQVKASYRDTPNTWLCYEQRYLQNRSCAEIAQELGITTNAVTQNIGRVLRKIAAVSEAKLKEIDDD
jgi:RNA polymerase sigma-70 factor (ECF subfamily)